MLDGLAEHKLQQTQAVVSVCKKIMYYLANNHKKYASSFLYLACYSNAQCK